MTDKGIKNRHIIRLICYGALLLLVMCGIFLMSAFSGEESAEFSNSLLEFSFFRWLAESLPPLTEKTSTSIRKYAHIFEYFCLGASAFLFFRELLWKTHRPFVRAAGCSVLLSFLYACSDEWHQTFVAERAGRFSDVAFDSIGFLSGIILLLICSYFRHWKCSGRETKQ